MFDETVEAKSACIDQLNQLDSGFEKLYAQVAEELDQNREDYAKEIRDMQQCIRRVTDKSVKIQAQEARNKELMREKLPQFTDRQRRCGKTAVRLPDTITV